MNNIYSPIFPANTWGGDYNIKKSNNAGEINLFEAQGDFAGETFEDDPYNRVNGESSNRILELKVLLEGPFNNIGMTIFLNGILPLSQPYNTYP